MIGIRLHKPYQTILWLFWSCLVGLFTPVNKTCAAVKPFARTAYTFSKRGAYHPFHYRNVYQGYVWPKRAYVPTSLSRLGRLPIHHRSSYGRTTRPCIPKVPFSVVQINSIQPIQAENHQPVHYPPPSQERWVLPQWLIWTIERIFNPPLIRAYLAKLYNRYTICHPDIATTYHHIGTSYYRKGDYNQALHFYQKALEMKKKVYGDQPHLDIATSYNNIGLTYDNQGNYDQALQYYYNDLDISQKVYGGQPHPDIAIAYNNIGAAYHSKQDYDQALHFYQMVLDMQKALCSDQMHPHIAIAYHNIGTIYDNIGDHAQATALYEKASHCCKKVSNSHQ